MFYTKLEIIPRLSTEKHSSYVYRVLLHNIVSLTLEPGTEVNEQELADCLKVSRTPLREAISRLKEARLMESYPQSGTRVSLIDVEYLDSVAFMRNAVETKVLRTLCLTPPSNIMLEKLQNNLEMQRIICGSSTVKYDSFLHLDRAFHNLLCEAAGFPLLSEIIGNHLIYFDWLSSLLLRFGEATPSRSYEGHQQWLRVVMQADFQAAEDVVNAHLSAPHTLSSLPNADRYFVNYSRNGYHSINSVDHISKPI